MNALRYQELSVNKWELLLVDNASKDALKDAWDISWHPNARHLFEGKLGLSHARQCGIQNSSAELLLFVDDDNVLEPNYIAEAVRICDAWPELGVWGSSTLIPEFELEPPKYLEELLPGGVRP